MNQELPAETSAITPPNIRHSSAIWLAFAALLLVGLYGSLKVVFATFGIDPDATHSIMLWEGVKAHGFGWVRDWIFTQDNWLFSLVPLHFLGFFLFGAKPSLVIVSGWLIFVASAFVSGLIAWQLNARRAAIALPLVLLFVGLYAHQSGFASYSTSHNITNLLGLASISLLLTWLRTGRYLILVLVTFLFAIGAVSDPWMIAAYNLPIAIVSVCCWLVPETKVARIDCAKLLIVSVIPIVLVKSQMFGVLDFLPHMHFQFGNWGAINHNAIFYVRDLGGLLSVIPLGYAPDFVPALISIVLVAALTTKKLADITRANIHKAKQIFVFLSFAFFSIGGISAAFILGSVETSIGSARFLLNCLYLITIILAITIDLTWVRSSRMNKALSMTVTALFLASSITSTAPVWKTNGFANRENHVIGLIAFLKKNNLSYGYGPYWGSGANATTTLSNGEVRLRPVMFNRTDGTMLIGGRPQSSRRWYTVEDIPLHQKEYFVIATTDGEECHDVTRCISGLQKQFGETTRMLKYGNATILVWDRPLLGRSAAPEAAQ